MLFSDFYDLVINRIGIDRIGPAVETTGVSVPEYDQELWEKFADVSELLSPRPNSFPSIPLFAEGDLPFLLMAWSPIEACFPRLT